MAARNRRRRRRRGRFGFLYKLLSLVLILAALVAGCIVFFRVEEIVVSGSAVYTDEEVVAAAGVERGDNLFLVGEMQTSRRILDQLPYLKDVNLRRVLPDTLVITVTECVPAGAVQGEDGSWWVLDLTCKLLERGDAGLAGRYAAVTGLTPLMPEAGEALAVSVEESPKLTALKGLLEALEERELLEGLAEIDLTGSAEILLRYTGRFTVRMPLYSDDFRLLARTLQEVASASQVTDYLEAGRTGTVDLTGSRPHFILDTD